MYSTIKSLDSISFERAIRYITSKKMSSSHQPFKSFLDYKEGELPDIDEI